MIYSKTVNLLEKKRFSTNNGNNVLIRTKATVLPVNVCDDVVIGARSVVTKDIKKKGFYAGNPAEKLR